MERLIVFDLDGTLARSKSSLDGEMVVLLNELLRVAKVAVISGGDWPQFQTQLLARNLDTVGLANMFLLPTCGAKFYSSRDGRWEQRYSEDLTAPQKQKIADSLQEAMTTLGFAPEKTWGEVIEDRGTQITMSALGQQAPLEEKERWDPDFTKRKKMQSLLEGLIPEFSVRLGGTTSIDVTRPGIDKAYGIGKLRDILDIPTSRMIFIGDALFPGGNDYPAKEAGVPCVEVRDPEDTKVAITAIAAVLRGAS
ncbi:MAG: phosphomannomutase [Actinomycetota bacterium]|jgi:HAD superfamily hydrolase (TIGR01484 family)|nr:phosphomannomutase [Actinomycetota bacterium]